MHIGQAVVESMKTELRASIRVAQRWLEWETSKPDGMPSAFQGMIDSVQDVIDGGRVESEYQLYSLLTL